MLHCTCLKDGNDLNHDVFNKIFMEYRARLRLAGLIGTREGEHVLEGFGAMSPPPETFKFYSVLKLLETHLKLILSVVRNEPMQIDNAHIIVTTVCISYRAVRLFLNWNRLEKVPIF